MPWHATDVARSAGGCVSSWSSGGCAGASLARRRRWTSNPVLGPRLLLSAPQSALWRRIGHARRPSRLLGMAPGGEPLSPPRLDGPSKVTLSVDESCWETAVPAGCQGGLSTSGPTRVTLNRQDYRAGQDDLNVRRANLPALSTSFPWSLSGGCYCAEMPSSYWEPQALQAQYHRRQDLLSTRRNASAMDWDRQQHTASQVYGGLGPNRRKSERQWERHLRQSAGCQKTLHRPDGSVSGYYSSICAAHRRLERCLR